MSQVADIKAKVAALSPEELREVAGFLESLRHERGRRQAVETVCGKYRDLLPPSEDFMERKAREKALEEPL
jgi:hypothetical protein